MQSFQLILVLFSIRFFKKIENNNDKEFSNRIFFSIADFSEIVKYIFGFFETHAEKMPFQQGFFYRKRENSFKNKKKKIKR